MYDAIQEYSRLGVSINTSIVEEFKSLRKNRVASAKGQILTTDEENKDPSSEVDIYGSTDVEEGDIDEMNGIISQTQGVHDISQRSPRVDTRSGRWSQDIGDGTILPGWRLSFVNRNFELCSSYPEVRIYCLNFIIFSPLSLTLSPPFSSFSTVKKKKKNRNIFHLHFFFFIVKCA